MSEWEDFCESIKIDPHDPDQFDQVLDRWSKSPESMPPQVRSDAFRDRKPTETVVFGTYQEAAAWARLKPGKAFVRAPDGQHFIPAASSADLSVSRAKRPNRFKGLKGYQIASLFVEAIQQCAPHLLMRYTTTTTPFSESAFMHDIERLGKERLLGLKDVIEEMADNEREGYQFLMREIKRTHAKASKYRPWQRERWIDDLDRASALTTARLNRLSGMRSR